MINVGFSIDDGDEGLEDDDDLTPWKEVDGIADEASNMEGSKLRCTLELKTLQAARVGQFKIVIISSGLAAPG